MSKPVYYAYIVKEYTVGSEKRSAWNRAGAVFAHRDGEGFDIMLDALPVDGRLTLRKPKPEEVPTEAEPPAAAGNYAALKPKK